MQQAAQGDQGANGNTLIRIRRGSHRPGLRRYSNLIVPYVTLAAQGVQRPNGNTLIQIRRGSLNRWLQKDSRPIAIHMQQAAQHMFTTFSGTSGLDLTENFQLLYLDLDTTPDAPGALQRHRGQMAGC